MRKYLFAVLVIVVMVAMKQADQDKMQLIKYRSYERQDGKEKKVLYCIKVPEDGKMLTVKGSHEEELQVSYSDSSFIYITNDAESGSPLNYKNKSSQGNVYVNQLLKDTVLLEGNQNNGRYWKEKKLGHIVIGYFNVPTEKRTLYDKSLSTLKKK